MKLKTQLFLFPVLVVILTVMITVSLFFAWRETGSVLDNEVNAVEINTLVHQLEMHLHLYELDENSEHIKHWEDAQQRLSLLLLKAPMLPAEQQTLLNSIKGLNRGIAVLFDRLLSISGVNEESSEKIRAHLLRKISTQLEVIVEDSNHLAQLARETLWHNHSSQVLIVGGLLIVLTFVMTGLAFSLSFRIQKQFLSLKDGLKRLEQGDFSDSVKVQGTDEFSDFVHAFNSMQQRLEETTVTRDALQQVVEERTHALKHIASTDPLTQVSNRRKLTEQAELEIARSRRHGEPLSLLIIDADHFKHVNDRYGHTVGDQVLIYLCRLCESLMRENDLLARYGGEEFVILLPHTDLRGANELAVRIQERLKEHAFNNDRHIISLTVSIGIAILEPEQDFAGLISDADQALFKAKELGRDCIQIASYSDQASSSNRLH
jgi:diguanylate cyclase (GGDEF)-like protein